MLERQLERLSRCRKVSHWIVATTTLAEDEAILALATRLGVTGFAGSTEDVLDRYYQAARTTGAETIVRVTGDCPLIDPALTDAAVELLASGLDYASVGDRYPDGLDSEVFSAEALATAWREARLKSEREHVTPFLWKQPERFRIGTLMPERDLSAHRWTVDEPCDLDFVTAVYQRLYDGADKPFGLSEVLALLEREPGLREINQGIARNAGYAKSLAEDRAL
jgi:spore coat polysaccharide biosynthesis protein SpsF